MPSVEMSKVEPINEESSFGDFDQPAQDSEEQQPFNDLNLL